MQKAIKLNPQLNIRQWEIELIKVSDGGAYSNKRFPGQGAACECQECVTWRLRFEEQLHSDDVEALVKKRNEGPNHIISTGDETAEGRQNLEAIKAVLTDTTTRLTEVLRESETPERTGKEIYQYIHPKAHTQLQKRENNYRKGLAPRNSAGRSIYGGHGRSGKAMQVLRWRHQGCAPDDECLQTALPYQ